MNQSAHNPVTIGVSRTSIAVLVIGSLCVGTVVFLMLGGDRLVLKAIEAFLTGVAYGVLLWRTRRRLETAFQPACVDRFGKDIIVHGGANFFQGYVYVSGWLCLTQDSLYFLRDPTDPDATCSWSTEEIADVRRYNVLFVVPNGVKCHLRTGEVLKFAVDNPTTWIEYVKLVLGR